MPHQQRLQRLLGHRWLLSSKNDTRRKNFQPTLWQLVGRHVIVRQIAATDWHELFASQQTLKYGRCTRRPIVIKNQFSVCSLMAQSHRARHLFVDRQCGKVVGSSRYNAYNPPPVKKEIGWTFPRAGRLRGTDNREIRRLATPSSASAAVDHAMKTCRRAWKIAARRNPGKLPQNPFAVMGPKSSNRETASFPRQGG
jgi:hypothetical protein